MTDDHSLHIFAPAKINLFLHVTGRRDNGYHELDSLVSFADTGDDVAISPATDFSFTVDGPFAGAFSDKEKDASPHSANIAVKAAWEMSRLLKKPLNLSLHLTKALPLAGGMGGGSSNAAAVIWGLMKFWDVHPDEVDLQSLMIRLGADVPVCLRCEAARVQGIGEILHEAPMMEEVPVVLVHPGKPCPTDKVFAHYLGDFREPKSLPSDLREYEDLVLFLRNRHNDLYRTACDIVPDIMNVVKVLEGQKGCGLGRMSGSGSSCFGLFETHEDAQRAAHEIRKANPDWWVDSATLNRPERY